MDAAQAMIRSGYERFDVGNDDVQPFELSKIVLGIIIFRISANLSYEEYPSHRMAEPGTIPSFANLTKLSPSACSTTFGKWLAFMLAKVSLAPTEKSYRI